MTDSSDLATQLGAALAEQYVVERLLGQGGMAAVFLVRDLALKRNLAVKVLSPDMITSRSVLERFRREAETVAQLSHPNVVPLHFIGQQGDLLYLAMQCVDGGSVADWLQRDRTLPVEDVVRVAREVASALAHAHARGIVHRDIKPANVLLDAESGRALVTDFGIARSAVLSSLTATGVTVGTPAYLSPEQVTGEPSDHRVDIYALGVMMYEMLAGHVPFDGATPTAMMLKRLAGPPTPVTTPRPDVPAEIAAVIERCLEADPAARFETANDVVDALGGRTATTGGRATRGLPAARRPKSIAPLLVGGSALLTIGLAVWWSGAGREPRAVAANAAIAAPVRTDGLVNIAEGDYVVGTDSGPAIARPRHVEHVSAFRIERTEVTTGAYEQFVLATRAPAPWSGATPVATMPVTHVPWGDAANYCAWKHQGGGRLPTEVEWEAAARGIAGRAYPYGTVADAARANTASARRDGPSPVGSFSRGATPDGIEDMSGNVWEWTGTAMHAYPGALPLPDSMKQYRVIRGGAFDTSDSIATGWMRGYFKASAAAKDLPKIGFRCVVPSDSARANTR